jgi:hypothetical protein
VFLCYNFLAMKTAGYAILAIAAVGIALAQSNAPEKRVAVKPTSLSAEKSAAPNAAQNNPPVTVIVEQDNAAIHKPPEQHDEESARIQRKLVTFTGWLVVVGFLQGIILAFTVIAINRQTGSTQNAERAWVMADLEWDLKKWSDGEPHIYIGTGTEGDSTGIYVVLSCKNEGSSPAWIDEKRAKFEIVSALPPRPVLNPEDIKGGTGIEPIGTGRTALPHTTEVKFQPIASGHIEDGKMGVIYGVVFYRDIFGKKRATNFGYRITRGNQLLRLDGYPEYNKGT